jgi:hypothetical protein
LFSLDEIKNAFVSYYRNLFTTASSKNIELCTSSICSKVFKEMNNNLIAMFTDDEVKLAIDHVVSTLVSVVSHIKYKRKECLIYLSGPWPISLSFCARVVFNYVY